MPFEPKIYHDDQRAGSSDSACDKMNALPEDPIWDDAEALDLPDDLAFLADQLRDDAEYLAARHPADATLEQRELAWKEFVDGKTANPHPSRRWRWVSAAAALVLTVAVAGWMAYFNASGTPQRSSIVANESSKRPMHIADQEPAPFGATQLGAEIDKVEPSDGSTGSMTELPGSQPRLIPASFLRDVSGPELDGMLDLLEEDESGLSI